MIKEQIMMINISFANFSQRQSVLMILCFAVIGLAIGAVALGGFWSLPAIAVVAAIALFFFLRRPALLFAFYCASILFESILVLQGWEGVTMTRYLGFGAGGLFLAQMLRLRRVKLPPPAVMAWAGLFAWGAISVLWAVEAEQAIRSLWIHVRFFAVYVVAVMYPFRQPEVDWVKRAIMLSGVLTGILILYLYASQITFMDSVRASLVLGERVADPNHTAASLLLPFSLFLSATLSVRRIKLSSHILPLGILFAVIVLSGSRGGLLGLAVAVISLFIMHFGQHWKQKMKVVAVTVGGAVAGWLMWPLLPVELTQRFLLAEIIAGGGSGRLDIWTVGISAWLANPIVGYGFGSFGAIHTLWEGSWAVAHNIYLQLLVEMGIVGLVLLLIALGLGYNAHAKSSLERGATAGFLAVLGASFFLGTLYFDNFWLTLIMVEITRRVRPSVPAHELVSPEHSAVQTHIANG